MTPLAKLLVDDGLMAPKALSDHDRKYLRGLMTSIHCFDCSEVLPMCWDLVCKLPGKDYLDMRERIFLPAPKTWIEYQNEVGDIHAHHLEAVEGALCYWTMIDHVGGKSSIIPAGILSHDLKLTSQPDVGLGKMIVGAPEDGAELAASFSRMDYVLLSLINTPKIIGRQQRMPNRALERRLLRTFGAGNFPLCAWTTIQLQVTKPPEIDDGEPHEAHLTGHRALHFCRAHLRVRLGKIEYVSAHWRGDPAIGIKQSRYAVSP